MGQINQVRRAIVSPLTASRRADCPCDRKPSLYSSNSQGVTDAAFQGPRVAPFCVVHPSDTLSRPRVAVPVGRVLTLMIKTSQRTSNRMPPRLPIVSHRGKSIWTQGVRSLPATKEIRKGSHAERQKGKKDSFEPGSNQ